MGADGRSFGGAEVGWRGNVFGVLGVEAVGVVVVVV